MKSGEIEVLARGVCVVRGQVLLCHTRGASITYLPGGHVDFDESAPEALAREMEEEIGVRAEVGRFLGVVEHAFRQKGQRHCELNVVFAMRLPGLRPDTRPASCEGHLDFLWADVGRLAAVRLEPAPLCRQLPQWLRRRAAGAGWASTYT